MTDKKPKIAVVGCGYWGRNLVRNFYELGHLNTICDSEQSTLTEMTKKFPGIKALQDVNTVLSDPEINGVVIATPAVTHYDLAKRAIVQGKDVFVEKPIALKLHEAYQLEKLASENGRILMVGHILLYHPAVIRLKRLIDDGELGRIRYIYSNRLNMGKIRTEENILWSFAPHDISVIQWLLNEIPKEVNCRGESYLNEGVADTTLSYFLFKSGVSAHIHVSWLHPFKEQKLVVVGDKKMAVFDDTSPEQKLRIYAHSVNWIDRRPVAQKSEAVAIPFEDKEPLKEECQHFLQCIIDRKLPLTDGHQGIDVLKILNACQQSMENGGISIRIDEEKGESTTAKYFAHPTVILEDNISIGEGTKIWHYSHILPNSIIGRNCNIGRNVVIGPDASIGNGCKIQNNVSVFKGVTLEDYVFCGPSMVFTNVFNPRSEIRRMNELRPTLVMKGASLGANCTIICGVTIGQYAFVGAGAVVTKDTPNYALVSGSPAKLQGWMCECGLKLSWNSGEAFCTCGKHYRKDQSDVRRLE
jgi:UDP-2-acetamido-3-amino-2,3-dideoxy-glucuronate N-acetyltransferase